MPNLVEKAVSFVRRDLSVLSTLYRFFSSPLRINGPFGSSYFIAKKILFCNTIQIYSVEITHLDCEPAHEVVRHTHIVGESRDSLFFTFVVSIL